MVPGSPAEPYSDAGRPAKGIDLGGKTLEPPRIGRGRPGSLRGAPTRRTGLRAARSAVLAKAGTERDRCREREFLNICSRAPRFQLNKASAAAPSSSVPSHQDPRTCPGPA